MTGKFSGFSTLGAPSRPLETGRAGREAGWIAATGFMVACLLILGLGGHTLAGEPPEQPRPSKFTGHVPPQGAPQHALAESSPELGPSHQVRAHAPEPAPTIDDQTPGAETGTQAQGAPGSVHSATPAPSPPVPPPPHLYSGPHPYLDHICLEEGLHRHDFAPKDTTFYRIINGVHYFVGDLAAYGFNGYLYPYQGHHPIPDRRGGGYCNIAGPHHHHWAPLEPSQYQIYNGWYFYNGPWGAHYQPHWNIHMDHHFPHYHPYAWRDYHYYHGYHHYWGPPPRPVPGGRTRNVVGRRTVVEGRSGGKREDGRRGDSSSRSGNNSSLRSPTRPVMGRGQVVRDRSPDG